MPILLRYEYAPGHEPENCKASAKPASYKQALAAVRALLLAQPEPLPMPEDLPRQASRLVFADTNGEDWRGTVLVWGTEPELCLEEEADSGDSALSLRIDGVDYPVRSWEELSEEERLAMLGRTTDGVQDA